MPEGWIAAHPDDIIALRVTGGAYIQQARMSEAQQVFERILAKVPNDAQSYNNLALLYKEIGDPRSLSYAERAYELAPMSPDCPLRLRARARGTTRACSQAPERSFLPGLRSAGD